MLQVRDFLSDESGVTAIEYALIASLIAVFIIVAVQAVGTQVSTVFNEIAARSSERGASAPAAGWSAGAHDQSRNTIHAKRSSAENGKAPVLRGPCHDPAREFSTATADAALPPASAGERLGSSPADPA